MVTKKEIEEFFSQPNLALVGVSRKGNKFGNGALTELKSKGYNVFVVHPEAQEIQGERCYPSLQSLPEAVSGVVLVVPPAQTDLLVKEANTAGIRQVWMQPGAESPTAVQYCEEHGMKAITGECIMMHPNAQGFHGFHRSLRSIFGKMPR